ncbi:MAG: heme biosynthesis protein HemY, partial [Hyphomicrobiales bacterium]
RVVLFLVFIGLVALVAAWLADRPGMVTIVWLDRRIEMSVMVAAAAVGFIAACAVIFWVLMRFILRSPGLVARGMRSRRRSRAFQFISKGLIAVGAGDAAAARKYAAEADRLAGDEPLALLLSAQTAQLSGDRASAERAFRDMAKRVDTRMLGLRGLYVEAQRRDDMLAARHFAEEAANSASAPAWARRALLESQCTSGDWTGALATLEGDRRAGSIDKTTFRRQRAVLLTARAMTLSDHEPDEARALTIEAVRLAPDLVPAAALAGRLLAEKGETRRAAKILEIAWRSNPHPDLAETYAYLKPGDSARDRLARVQTLARQPAGHVEGALAIARAALDAREFETARQALAPLTDKPIRRVATLMAELEQVEHGDEGRAREWMARALRAPQGPVWNADGFVSDRWLPISPVSGHLDAFRWQPVSGAVGETPLIEAAVPTSPAVEAALTMEKHDAPVDTTVTGSTSEANVSNAAASSPAEVKREDASTAPVRKPERKAEPVIPLVHAPDDPGPEPEPEPNRAPPVNNRRGMRLFFR